MALSWYQNISSPAGMQGAGWKGNVKKFGGKEGEVVALLTQCEAPCRWIILPENISLIP